MRMEELYKSGNLLLKRISLHCKTGKRSREKVDVDSKLRFHYMFFIQSVR